MLIERILKDGPQGTIISMGDGVKYAFLPVEPDGRHVAEVVNPAHIERLLSITEGFRIFSEKVVPEADAVPQPDPDPQPDPEITPPSEDEIPLEAMTLTDLRALFEAETGARPHGRSGRDKIIADLLAHRAKGE